MKRSTYRRNEYRVTVKRVTTALVSPPRKGQEKKKVTEESQETGARRVDVTVSLS